MTPAEIVELATGEGVSLAITPAGTLTVTGKQSVIDRWIPTIRENKPGILSELRREFRRVQVKAMLEAAPGKRYAVHVADSTSDPVVVAVAIREIASFVLEIPQQLYDGFVLLDLIEERSGEGNENA